MQTPKLGMTWFKMFLWNVERHEYSSDHVFYACKDGLTKPEKVLSTLSNPIGLLFV